MENICNYQCCTFVQEAGYICTVIVCVPAGVGGAVLMIEVMMMMVFV